MANPINQANGNKLQPGVDYMSALPSELMLQRIYNGLSVRTSHFGIGWSSNFDRAIFIGNGKKNAAVRRPDGSEIAFTLTNGKYVPDVNVDDVLTLGGTNGSVWTYNVAADDSVETYDDKGRLISVKTRGGIVTNLGYSTFQTAANVAPRSGLLISVTDSFSHQIKFTYDSLNRVNTMTDPVGNVTTYSYDQNNRLIKVTYPPFNNVSESVTYLYNESAHTQGAYLPSALTGIIDGNNVRFSTYSYDSKGRAVSSEHAGGVYKYNL